MFVQIKNLFAGLKLWVYEEEDGIRLSVWILLRHWYFQEYTQQQGMAGTRSQLQMEHDNGRHRSGSSEISIWPLSHLQIVGGQIEIKREGEPTIAIAGFSFFSS